MKYHGFTLIEALMVIILVAIIGAIISPTLSSHAFFSKKHVAQDLLSLLRYAKLMAKVSDCEIQLSYQSKNQLTLLWRSQCQQGAFDKAVPSPYFYSADKPFVIQLPKEINLESKLPLYFLPQGHIVDKNHQIASQINLPFGLFAIIIDSASGFAYVK